MILAKTPLRLGLLGGGSDIPSYYMQDSKSGMVINAAIDKYVYVLVRKRHDDYIYLKYSQNEIVHKSEIDAIQHDFIRETLKYLQISEGLEIICFADVPTTGLGLGSSSSFLVGLLNALHTLYGDNVSKETLAEEACYIEIELCNKPIGKQDQYIAALGGLKCFEFKKNMHDQKEDLDDWGKKDFVTYSDIFTDKNYIKEFSNYIMMFYTGITRESKDILTEQNKNAENITLFMDKNVELTKELLYKFRNSLSDNFNFVGEYVKNNWEIKKNFASNISNQKIDDLIDITYSGGAIGSKITGAGRGGFIVSIVAPYNRLKLKFTMGKQEITEMPVQIDLYGTRIILNIEENFVWKSTQ